MQKKYANEFDNRYITIKKLLLLLVFLLIVSTVFAGCTEEKNNSYRGTYSTGQEESEENYYVCVDIEDGKEDSDDKPCTVCIYKQGEDDYYLATGENNNNTIKAKDDRGVECSITFSDDITMNYDSLECSLEKIDDAPTFVNNNAALEAFNSVVVSEEP